MNEWNGSICDLHLPALRLDVTKEIMSFCQPGWVGSENTSAGSAAAGQHRIQFLMIPKMIPTGSNPHGRHAVAAGFQLRQANTMAPRL